MKSTASNELRSLTRRVSSYGTFLGVKSNVLNEALKVVVWGTSATARLRTSSSETWKTFQIISSEPLPNESDWPNNRLPFNSMCGFSSHLHVIYHQLVGQVAANLGVLRFLVQQTLQETNTFAARVRVRQNERASGKETGRQPDSALLWERQSVLEILRKSVTRTSRSIDQLAPQTQGVDGTYMHDTDATVNGEGLGNFLIERRETDATDLVAQLRDADDHSRIIFYWEAQNISARK